MVYNEIGEVSEMKKNANLKKLIDDRFEMDVSLNKMREEAATGAALFSALAIGLLEYKG